MSATKGVMSEPASFPRRSKGEISKTELKRLREKEEKARAESIERSRAALHRIRDRREQERERLPLGSFESRETLMRMWNDLEHREDMGGEGIFFAHEYQGNDPPLMIARAWACAECPDTLRCNLKGPTCDRQATVTRFYARKLPVFRKRRPVKREEN